MVRRACCPPKRGTSHPGVLMSMLGHLQHSAKDRGLSHRLPTEVLAKRMKLLSAQTLCPTVQSPPPELPAHNSSCLTEQLPGPFSCSYEAFRVMERKGR